MKNQIKQNHYKKLGIMIILHFIAMYSFMYVVVNSFRNVFHRFNQFYMAGLMTSSMTLIEVPLEHSMYHNKKLNIIIVGGGVIALITFYMFIREQTAITDTQFLKSMIPHHTGFSLRKYRSKK